MMENKYIQGGISGMFGICLSHPIDTIKTLYQTGNNKYKFKNLYKGISSPLIGVGIEKAVVFGTYNYCKKNNISTPLSGAISGFAASIIVSPYERIKILKQPDQKIDFRFLFKGLGITFFREVPGFAIYFKVFEVLKNTSNTNYSSLKTFIFGGIAGSVAWVFIYPQDRIKTIIQSTNEKNTKHIIQTILKNGELYNGFSFAIARAFLLHSGTFFMMERLQNYSTKYHL